MKYNPGEPPYFASMPTARTRFLRTFLPWQVLRFLWINFLMIRMIRKTH